MGYENLLLKSEIEKCFLCNNSPCTNSCPENVPIDRIIRALRFENIDLAKELKMKNDACKNCKSQACMTACKRASIDSNYSIKNIIGLIGEPDAIYNKNIDISTELCNVRLENPFILSSSVVGSNYEMVAKAFEMGWAGVAFKTIGLFVPDEVSPRFSQISKETADFIGFKNIEQISDHTLDENIEFIRKLKKDYPSKIIIASIMGRDNDEWTKLAMLMEEAGADIIECNFSCPHMTDKGLGSDVGTNPDLVYEYTRATKKGTKLPILAKMTPNITNMEIPAIASIQAGADGLAAINTIKSIMNINTSSFVSEPQVRGKSSMGGYSGKAVKPIALRFINDIKQNEKLKNIPISGMGGIENCKDAFEFIAMGCSTVQITTAVMQYGYRIIDDLIDGLRRIMEKNNIKSIKDIEGKALSSIVSADELDRATICYPRFDRKKCVGCGRCYISCFDGGHQAIKQNKTGDILLDASKCVGCHLCVMVCPVGAISPGTIIEKEL